jgi:predicted nucleic acid-binding protein
LNVLVDTCVWSLALRRRQPPAESVVHELGELIREGRAQIIGPLRQEILSGILHSEHFLRLCEKLRAFPDLEPESRDFERAAEIFNHCRSLGIQGSNTDFLLCAVAERLAMPILTTDKDFELFAEHTRISLHPPRPLPAS